MTVDEGLRHAVERRSRAFEAAYAVGDARSLVEVYFAQDADGPLASAPGGLSPVRGRAALVGMFEGMFEGAPVIRLETVELDASGDLAFEMGRAHLSLAAGGAAIGRYCACWIRRNGDWRVRIDFFSADGWSE